METQPVNENNQPRALKMLVSIAVAGIAMFFLAFTSAYIVLQADHFWVVDTLPQMFAISTVIIVLSSVTLYLATRANTKGNVSGLKMWLGLTFILGIGFSATQYLGWAELKSEGKFFVGDLSQIKGEYGVDYTILMKGEPVLYDNGNYYKPGDIGFTEPINDRINEVFNISGSFLYLLTFLHLIHLLGGLIWLIVLVVRSNNGSISAANPLPLELGSIYWHFLDILWVYLFLFLLLFR